MRHSGARRQAVSGSAWGSGWRRALGTASSCSADGFALVLPSRSASFLQAFGRDQQAFGRDHRTRGRRLHQSLRGESFMVDDAFAQAALNYHRHPIPGKVEGAATKPLGNQRDLALAYTPGVAAACRAIVADPAAVSDMTARANLVGVVTNGTAVLGLGAIGPLASKPVMEGKAVLFKKFAGIDVFDIEIAEQDPQKLIEIIAALEPTFGGINLEDIKAPECFIVERELRKRMKIPVFHDDQHGTAIIVNAAIYNGLYLVKKEISEVKVVCSGAGAAAMACLDLLVELGAKRENIYVADIEGLIYKGREALMDAWKARYAQATSARRLDEVIEGA